MISSILSFLLKIATWAFVAFFLVSLFLKNTKFFSLINPYVEIVLTPFRTFLFSLFPAMSSWKIDISPLALALVLRLLSWIAILIGKLI